MAPRKSATDGTKKPEVLVVEVQPEEAVEEKVVPALPTEKKYRCDFNSWKEYEAYKGPKG